MMKRKKIDLVTLGCSKNLVDSERLMKMLDNAGFAMRHNPEGTPGDIVVINTCGFIGDAKEESINTILEYCALKQEGKIDSIYVMGCLSERYRDELPAEIPEVDAWFGKFDWTGLVKQLAKQYPAKVGYDRIITTGKYNAYVKISEGCDRFCSFCAIPLITGRHTSRKIDEIVDEVKGLAAHGVTELNIIAQDLSSYGKDIYGEKRLAQLVDAISKVDGIKWIRLHYAYPADFPYDVLDVMRENPKVCKYLDIALQHIADPVLTNMRRHINGEQTRQLIRRIRQEVPGIHLRTTLMVGFPGEGEEEFRQLLDFVKETKFERMGAFAYCEEEDTYGAKTLDDNIPEDVKQKRLDEVMALQESISLDIQQQKVGSQIEVVVDREEDDYYVGRSQWDSPEVDPEVLIEKTRELNKGQYIMVKVKSAMPFELIAEPV
jgi:ribosomal protein S12 methylthiotransferase